MILSLAVEYEALKKSDDKLHKQIKYTKFFSLVTGAGLVSNVNRQQLQNILSIIEITT
ncbi:16898_t:CDS:2 [Funneliformis mosseae]|uniref:16898_t:CDS:1 n=1 Tax=Funneliformis mosseae TaxID=27381 RepID=A0A9N9CHE1_FUNMO|nr:16898_t:CDS:2 [Funneliformis mosseae]